MNLQWKTVREKKLEIGLAVSTLLNILGYFMLSSKEKLGLDLPNWLPYVLVAVVGIYYTYKYYDEQKYPVNALGALRIATEYVNHGLHGSSIDVDTTFYNREIVELSPTNFLVGFKKPQPITLFIPMERGRVMGHYNRGLDEVRREMEESNLITKSLESEMASRKMKQVMRERGLVAEEEEGE